jgi:hypothetical protein
LFGDGWRFAVAAARAHSTTMALSVNQLGFIDTTGLDDFFRVVADGLGGTPSVVSVCDNIARTLKQEHLLLNVSNPR